MTAPTWELVKLKGETVYHRAMVGTERRVTARLDRNVGVWRWAVYDMTRGSRTGGLKIDEGARTSYFSARSAAVESATQGGTA
jgi:hypothetical protein